MMKNITSIIFVVCYVLLCTMVLVKASRDDERKAYIVYMGELPQNNEAKLTLMDQHHHLLSDIVGDVKLARESKIHSYGRSFNGFVALLLPHEAAKLKEKESVVSVFPNGVNKLLTTRSWDFLKMAETVKRNQQVETNIIVATLDTGVWMESPSFDDKGYGPPPKKWKGKCDKGLNFTGCNNKVIGARFFSLENPLSPEDETPVDTDGHGTHTASTAAGIAVPGANLYGVAKGTARGGVPSARIASYKVCWSSGCQDMDLLAAFDAAIADGVDIISLSIGGPSRNYFEDPIAIGSFHALKKGILTSCAGGNDGPDLYSVQNVAPWLMTVAASGIDRQFQTAVKLGNGKVYYGVSINTFQPHKKMYPLTSGALAQPRNGSTYGNASACDDGTLSGRKVKGVIVYCLGRGAQDYTISEMKGAGVIISSNELSDTALPTFLPETMVGETDGREIEQYINSNKFATAVIYRSTSIFNPAAPFVASFSSRGPQSTSLNILKPDIAAPGVSILAAFSQLTSLTGDTRDKRIVKYNIESGTSMACPHVAGAAAYLKSFHPDWSPAAIKSALMTTAKSMIVRPVGDALASGSGLLNPTKALNPGLVYDIDIESYISFLCKEGYNSTSIALLTGDKYDCSKVARAKGQDGLNYPSMHLQLENHNSSTISAVFYRTLTNVAQNGSVYNANIKAPKDLSISVVPNKLSFSKRHQRRSFKVSVTGKFASHKSWFLSASLVWSDSSKHHVRSPILVIRTPTTRY